MKPIQAIFFDLDGTLFDTAPEICDALNKTLQDHGHTPIAEQALQPLISHGTPAMLASTFGLKPTDPEYKPIQEIFLNHYEKILCSRLNLYPGISETLQWLDDMKLPWGIITNKLARFTKPILDHFHFTSRARCCITADMVQQPKPHPEPLLSACNTVGVTPTQCIYIGDAKSDVIAAKAAGMIAGVACYGYIPNTENPEEWVADVYFESAHAIYEWIQHSTQQQHSGSIGSNNK